MNTIKFEGNVIHSDIIFLPGNNNASVCRIVLKNNELACMPVCCFGEMAVRVKKEIRDDEVIQVFGKIVTYIFHDDFDTEKNVTMILAKEVKIKNLSLLNTHYEKGMEEACLSAMCKHDMLPVSEEDCDLIARQLTELSW